MGAANSNVDSLFRQARVVKEHSTVEAEEDRPQASTPQGRVCVRQEQKHTGGDRAVVRTELGSLASRQYVLVLIVCSIW